VFDYNGFCTLVYNSDIILNNLASGLTVPKKLALLQAQNFFIHKNVIVQTTGVQGAVYQLGSVVQTRTSFGFTVHTLQMARLVGVNGLQVLKAQSFLAIAIANIGSLFFHACSLITVENLVGKTLSTTVDVLALPMRSFEIMWNSYGNTVIQKIFGIPVIFNLTQTVKRESGYTIEEIVSYIPLNHKSYC
jgi:hypothetical protein